MTPAHRRRAVALRALLLACLAPVAFPSTARAEGEKAEEAPPAPATSPPTDAAAPAAPAAPAPAPATPAPAAGDAPADLPPVVVIGTPDAVRRLPGSGQVVTAAEIREQGQDDIHAVLSRVPGAYVRPEDGLGLFPNISLRGTDTIRMSKLTVLEDGVPAVPAPYSAPEAYYSPTTARMSAIEVLKGSSQIRYGPHTTGGVINYLATPVPDAFRGYVRTTIGQYSDLRTHAWIGGTVQAEAGRFGFLVEEYYRETDGFKDVDETPDFRRDATGFRKSEPMVRAFFEPATGPRQRLEFKYGETDMDADETYLGLTDDDFDDDPYRRYAASRFDRISTEHRRLHLRHTLRATDTVDVTTTYYYTWFHRDWFKLNDIRTSSGTRVSMSRALAEGGDALAVLRGRAAGELRVRHNNRDYYVRGIESSARWRLDGEAVDHTVTAGVRRHEDQVDRLQWDENYTQDANGTITGRTVTAKGTAGNIQETARAWALFLQDEVAFGETTVTPGVRHERVHLKNDDTNAPADNGRETVRMTAFGIGATHRLDDASTLFGGIHQGFSSPAPGAAVADGLDEETSIGYELGIRHGGPRDPYSLEFSLFQTDFRHLQVVDNIGGAGTGRTEDVGRVRSRGAELLARYDPARQAGLAFRNPWTLTATLTQARIGSDADSLNAENIFAGAKSGNDVPYIPDLALALSTGVEQDRWGVHVSARYVSGVYTTGSNTRDPVTPAGTPDARFGKIDSYIVVDLAAHLDLTDHVRLVTGVQNLLDREYMVSRHPHGPRPGAPFTAWIGLEVSF